VSYYVPFCALRWGSSGTMIFLHSILRVCADREMCLIFPILILVIINLFIYSSFNLLFMSDIICEISPTSASLFRFGEVLS
jgi:hypothetical protein